MKIKTIIFSIVIVLLLGVSSYSFFEIQTFKKEVSDLKQTEEKLTKKLNEQEKNSKKLEKKLAETKKQLDDKSNELEESKKKTADLEKEISLAEEASQYVSPSVVNEDVITNQESYVNDPVAERDAFAAEFQAEHGRAPSSGETQMDWLKKQGLVE